MKNYLANSDLRLEMKRLGVPMWALADKQGLCELTVSRRLRRELTSQEKEELLTLIRQVAQERGVHDD